jgi:hypothetical protein
MATSWVGDRWVCQTTRVPPQEAAGLKFQARLGLRYPGAIRLKPFFAESLGSHRSILRMSYLYATPRTQRRKEIGEL